MSKYLVSVSTQMQVLVLGFQKSGIGASKQNLFDVTNMLFRALKWAQNKALIKEYDLHFFFTS